jgi:hypothetical protein
MYTDVTAITLTADETARVVGYRDGHQIRSMYRNGRFPAPIDPGLPVRLWRWSRRQIVRYVDQEGVA